MIIASLLCLLGLILLYYGAEWLVRGSSSLGLELGLSPLVVGLTVVAFGTSAPELAVSLNAAFVGKTDVAIANVVGSNIANIALILGLSAIVHAIQVDAKLIRIDIPIMIAASLLVCLFLYNGVLGRLEGVLLFAGVIVFTAFNVFQVKKETPAIKQEFETGVDSRQYGLAKDIFLIVAGIAVLTLGGRFLVDGAIQIARSFGISEAVIGLTIIAIGTSLPELATSMLAAAKKMSDISVGNIVGSNIFNLLAVLGASASLVPLPVGNITWIDMGVMLLFTLAVLPLAKIGQRIGRGKGLVLIAGYIAYLLWLVMSAGGQIV